MSDVFGFDAVEKDILDYINKADNAKEAMIDIADKMKESARQYAKAGGLYETGKGVSGIEKQVNGNAVTIGWSGRPGLHLYFHERGFHALDNRRKKWKLKRGKRGKGTRSYKGVRATYIPPTPHMRPAFQKHEQEFYRSVQEKIT